MSALPTGGSGTDSMVTIVTILFTLSMINERIANLIKLQRSKKPTLFFSPKRKREHEKGVQITALFTGWLTATIAGADLFYMISNHGNLIPITSFFDCSLLEGVQRVLGILITGVFLSLGSKFWHDMLDIVMQFAALKKYQAATASATAEGAQADTLATKVTLLEPQLRGMAGYAGYDFSSGSSPVNLKFETGNEPDARQSALITGTLGEGNFRIVSSNLKPAGHGH